MARRKYSYESKQAPGNTPPEVVPVVPRTGPWSGDNQLGYVVPYKPDRTGTQTVLKLDEWGPPEMWTVSLGIMGDAGTFDSFLNIAGILEWGSGGSNQTAEVDWLQGQTVSMNMNALSVKARFGVAPTDVPDNLRLSVLLSRGTKPGRPATRTFDAGTANAAGTGPLVRIPQFANRLYILPGEAALDGDRIYANDIYIRTYANSLGTQVDMSIRTSSVLSMMSGGGVPLPVTSKYARVVNASGNNVAYWLGAELSL